jgi:hypothetical protein
VRGLASVVVLTAAVGAMAGGCRHKAGSPDEAYRLFSRAVMERDGGALFDSLDQRSRWALMTVQKWHREAYDIVLSNYPEGPERQRELRRFEKGATAPSARALFKAEVAPGLFPTLAPLVAPNPRIEVLPSGNLADAVLPSGARVRLTHEKRQGWAYGGLGDDAEERKARAYHDLELVRASAADYERAAARSAR